jgi:hypothetical protein
MRGIGHICTTCILESQTYVLIMRSLHSGVLTSKRRKETHDYMGEMSVPNIRAVAPSHRENVWQEKGGGRYSPKHT